MAEPYARGIWARFAPTEHPFDAPTDMEDNLRTIDDHLAIYTLQAPVAVGSSLPASPANGAGQLIADGSYAVFNGGAWKTYPPVLGLAVMLANRTNIYVGTGTSWASLKDTLGITGLLAGQGSNIVGKATLADLNADLDHPAESVGWVLNDATAENNVLYRKTGGIGAGAWVPASNSLLTQIQLGLGAVQLDLAGAVASINRLLALIGVDGVFDLDGYANSGYSWAFTDASSPARVAAWIDAAGAFGLPGVPKVAAAIQALQLLSFEWGKESGYVWGVADTADPPKVAIGLNEAGQFIVRGQILDIAAINAAMPSLALVASIFSTFDTQSGYAWSVTDAADPPKVAIGVSPSGEFLVRGQPLDAPALNYVATFVVPTKDVACWGDSLTAGAGGTPFPTALAALVPTRNVYNRGVGGDAGRQIAFRQGGRTQLLTVAGNLIPSSGGVGCTIDYTGDTYYSTYGVEVLQSGQSKSGSIRGIPGLLSRSGATYTFTRTSAGSAVAVEAPLHFVGDGEGLDNCILVLWPGQNDPRSTAGNADVMAAVAQMVANAKTSAKRYIVMSVLGANAGSVGTSGYLSLMSLNDALRDAHPRNFVDVRAALIRAYNPAIPQDVTDKANDIVPSSLRSDAVHLNTAGYAIVAAEVKFFIESKGW